VHGITMQRRLTGFHLWIKRVLNFW
jgi:hypothetical protein